MIIVVTGPTGVGKTKLSISLAKKYNAEVINGDSIQVYKGLDIGSAKVTKEEMDGVVHHLFDIREAGEEYSIYDYQIDCRRLIEEITSRGKNIVIVGGTGLYIKSALFDYTLDDNSVINDQYDGIDTSVLYDRLKKVDKDIDIDRNNRRRVVRALNYYLTYNKSISENKNGNKLLYDSIFVGLTTDREILYDRINKRVDMMIEKGLLDEVKYFFDKGIKIEGIGYKELYGYFNGELGYEEAIELIKRNSRRYAKRQYTFFNNQFDIKWFSVDFKCFDNTIMDVCDYIEMKK